MEMKKYNQLFLVCVAIFFGVYGFFMTNVEASSKLDWTTTDLYYERDNDGNLKDILVIEGYFTNNTEQYINWFYEITFTANITADIGAGYKGTVKGTFRDFEQIIEPYSDATHRFRINNAQIIYPIDNYEVIRGYARWKQSRAAG